MSYNGSGTFVINTAGQPVVSGTVISSTAFNALTADLATGLSTAITKDGQTTPTANIPMGNNKITGLAVGTAATDAANLSQVQSTAAKLVGSVSGVDTITGTMSPTLAAYAAGQMFYFVAAGDNTGAVTLNLDGLGAKAVTRDGSVALAAGDIKSGEVVVVVYDGTRFQVVSQLNSAGNATFANVSITSALNVGGVATFSGGTANGVLYLNGSKVATSGSAFVFDGTNVGIGTASPAKLLDLAANNTGITTGDPGNILRFTDTDTTSAAGQPFGRIEWYSADTDGAGVKAYIQGQSQDGSPDGNLVFATHYVSGGGLAERMRIDYAGNVGIGTTNPAVKLDVAGDFTADRSATNATVTATLKTSKSGASSKNIINFYNTALDSGDPMAAIEQYDDGTNVNGSLLFKTNAAGTSATRMTIDQSGNVGIGTSSPGAKLDVNGSINIASTQNLQWGSSALAIAGASNILTFYTNSAERMRIDSSGNVGIGVTPSAWRSIDVAAQIRRVSLWDDNNNALYLGHNVFENSAGNYTYIGTDFASVYRQFDGTHAWQTAASGTAGTTISFTTAMTLDASGRLLLGTTTAGRTLTVYAASTPGIQISNSSSGTGTANGLELVQDGTDSTIYNQETGYLRFGTSGTEKARITSAGDFGIGTTSPGAKLDVQGNIILSASNATITFNSGGPTIICPSANTLAFTTSGTERARITAGGELLVGLTSSAVGEYLSVQASNSSWMARIANTNASPRGEQIIFSGASPNGTANWFLYCEDSTAQRASIRSNGGLANYQSNNVDLSDARTKKDITPAASMWDKIGALEIVTYKYNDQTHDDVNVGVIAQQVESVEPVWVDADGWGSETPEDGVPLKTVYTKDITFAAIKALQEAMARIEQLEAKVAALESK